MTLNPLITRELHHMRKIESEMIHNVMTGRDWCWQTPSRPTAPLRVQMLKCDYTTTTSPATTPNGRDRWFVEVNSPRLSDPHHHVTATRPRRRRLHSQGSGHTRLASTTSARSLPVAEFNWDEFTERELAEFHHAHLTVGLL